MSSLNDQGSRIVAVGFRVQDFGFARIFRTGGCPGEAKGVNSEKLPTNMAILGIIAAYLETRGEVWETLSSTPEIQRWALYAFSTLQ